MIYTVSADALQRFRLMLDTPAHEGVERGRRGSRARVGNHSVRNRMWVRLPAHTPPVESRGPRSYMTAAKKAPRKAPTNATRSRRPAAARGPESRESVI